jgi:predicted transcriptional regulator of viral defense system
LKDFNVKSQYKVAIVRLLSRLVAKGELEKISKGRYYKPRKTMFGTLKPAPPGIAKDFLEKESLLIGYITGTAAFAMMGLTTQIK